MTLRTAPRLVFAATSALLAVIATRSADAQGTQADYDRADGLRERTRGTVFGGVVRPRWLPGGDRFWYRSDRAEGSWRFVLVDPDRGEQGPGLRPRAARVALRRRDRTAPIARPTPDRSTDRRGRRHHPLRRRGWRLAVRPRERQPGPGGSHRDRTGATPRSRSGRPRPAATTIAPRRRIPRRTLERYDSRSQYPLARVGVGGRVPVELRRFGGRRL